MRSDLFTICFTPFDAFEILYDVFENIMENGAFALLNLLTELKFFLNFFQCLKIENDIMI